MFQKKNKHKVSAEGPEKHRVLVLQEERSLEFWVPIKEGQRENPWWSGKGSVGHAYLLKALFANISDSWWIGSSHHIFFRKEEFGADMIEELGSSYMGNGTSTVIRGRGNV